MTADARVVAVRPDGRIDLEFAPPSACSGCAGVCLWKRLAAARLDRLRTGQRFVPGAKVSVTLPARSLLLASIVVYGLPLVAMLGGAALGTLVLRSDLGTLVGGLAALATLLVAFPALRRRVERSTLAGLVVVGKQ